MIEVKRADEYDALFFDVLCAKLLFNILFL